MHEQVIPEPRCINSIRSSVEKNRYKDAVDAYTDISLVFWNALYYNEPSSQIAEDAGTLKVLLSISHARSETHKSQQTLLETEWKKRTVLPVPRTSPPPSAPQKVNPPVPEMDAERESSESESAQDREQKTAAAPPAAQSAPPRAPSSITRPASTEIDVDVVEVSDEADGARNGEGEEIIHRLETGLPKWEGFGDKGWMTAGNTVSANVSSEWSVI